MFVAQRRRGIRFWWDFLQLAASAFLLLVLVVAGTWFVFSEGLPWLGSGFTGLAAGNFTLASLVVLLLVSIASIVIVSGLVGFGSEIGRLMARRFSRKQG